MMQTRIHRAACLLAVMLVLSTLARGAGSGRRAVDEDTSDVVVYGGTSAGVIAAVQAARMGCKVVLIEPGRHLGGMTSGGLGATDFGRKETIGGLAREFYRRLKRFYEDPAAWKFERREDYRSYRNDLATEDAMWHFEPHAAEAIYNDMVREAKVEVVYGERLDLKNGVEKHGARIAAITMESGRRFAGCTFIDATYEGDLMAKAGVSYFVGRESNERYGETVNGVRPPSRPPHAADLFRPVDPYVIPGNPASGLLHGITPGKLAAPGSADKGVQAYNYRLCMTNVPENRVPFPKPADYDPARYELMLRHLQADGTDKAFPYYPNPLPVEHPGLGKDPFLVIMPNHKTDMNTKGAVSSDYVGMNWDYPDGDYATRERIIREHISYQQGMMWFLQHDPRVPARYREPMQEWGLARDEFTDTGHWPFQLYVREGRRMISDYVMIEQDCTGQRQADDSVGVGSYGLDSHFIRRYVDEDGWVQNEGNMAGVGARPYPIAYRSIVPRRAECENLLVPVCLSASHVAYGSIRMEPVYMILGQSAGTAAALASGAGIAVQAVDNAALRARLLADGQILEWSEAAAKPKASKPKPATGSAVKPASKQDVIVFKEPGRYGGWPANHGLWQWGDELVVGFTSTWFKHNDTGHAVDRDKPSEEWQARSLDGGLTWKVENQLPFADHKKEARPRPLSEPIDFTHPDFALMFRFGSLHTGPSWFYVSYDRCRNWRGPYAFAVEGIDRIATRTDLVVLGPRDCIMFGSAAKANGKEGRVFCARTSDGGLHWKLLSRIGPEPPGFAIMPSTLRLAGGALLTTIRHGDPGKRYNISTWRSDDGGRRWKSLGDATPDIGGNPPSLVQLKDGRVCLTYGYRKKPYGVRARISGDEGRSWGPEIILRDDGLTGDLGYPRSVVRPDGKVLTIYYFNGPRDEDRTIQGTLWTPPGATPGQ